MSRCVYPYITKHGQTILKRSIKQTWDLDISYAGELVEMWYDELWDLDEALQDKHLYILKPGIADRGMEIRLFNNKEVLQPTLEELKELIVIRTMKKRHFSAKTFRCTGISNLMECRL